MAAKKITKAELATVLAYTEVSVALGHQTAEHWLNAYKRSKRDELVTKVLERATGMNAETESVLRQRAKANLAGLETLAGLLLAEV